MSERNQRPPLSSSRPPHAARGFTARSLMIGAVLAFSINVACPYSVLILESAGLTSDYITAGAIMFFFVLVGIVNVLLKLIRRSWALSSSELILIYIMMIVASAIPTWGFVTNLFHILTHGFYYATPENRWEDIILPNLSRYLIPTDPAVSKYFYEGLPEGEGIPWGEWALPIAFWVSLIVVVYFVMISMMVILRKRPSGARPISMIPRRSSPTGRRSSALYSAWPSCLSGSG